MDGRERDSRVMRNDSFRPVAMMRVKIPGRDCAWRDAPAAALD